MDPATAARAAVAEHELVGIASDHLTNEVAIHLPFEVLVAFKNALKRFFTAQPWTEADADRLSDLVTPHLEAGWWEHELGNGLHLSHGIRGGRYQMFVTGPPARATSVFDRVFEGPVVPEQTPHPRKVMFHVGGAPAPGVWHRRGGEGEDPRVNGLTEDLDTTAGLVAGGFAPPWLQKPFPSQENLP